METEYVVLVDELDRELGRMEKMLAHETGKLHRAFSVFVFNSKKELLLQKRAEDKYHSAGLWTNTCCSHPRPGEATETAALRRLNEEMGISCELTYLFNFTYKEKLNNNLTENELDHVFLGFTDDLPHLNRTEVAEYRYVDLLSLENELKDHPRDFTVWFNIIFIRMKEEVDKSNV